MSKMYIIAGPNGSGKTTFAKEFLPYYAHCQRFVNADLIASGLAPFSPVSARIKAGRLLLEQIDNFVNEKVDFAMESTLSGKTYVQLIKKVKQKGYTVHVFFLWISNIQLARARIKQRVQEGGHNVLGRDIKRRFLRSTNNFLKLYKPLCDSWMVFDNSTNQPTPIVRGNSEQSIIFNDVLFKKISEG